MTARSQASLRAGESPGSPAGESPGNRLPFRDWGWREFLFFVGVPGGIAVYAALNNWRIIELAGYEAAILFYAAHAFIPWWTSAGATWIVMRLLRPWQPPQIVVLSLGILLACVLVQPYSTWMTEQFAVGWLAGDSNGQRSTEHIFRQMGFWTFTLRAWAVWILANLAFDRFLGYPRYRYMPPGAVRDAPHATDVSRMNAEAALPADPSLRFLQRLPASISAEQVIALKAEQHYIKVYTAERSFMTLFRFSDAVAEMEAGSGHQVHRSYWVRTSAIKALHRGSGRYMLELTNGLQVPISASNRGLVRELTRTSDITVHPPF